jgi:hypothetical protein
LTATSWSSCAAKLLPAGSCDEMELAVFTSSTVPAGIVAAFKEAAKQAQHAAISRMNLFCIIFVFKVDC